MDFYYYKFANWYYRSFNLFDKMSKRKIFFIIACILVCAGAFIAFNIFTGPVYSIYKSKKAIEKHNYKMFLEYVNLDSVINNFNFKIPVNEPEPEDTLEKLELELGMGILYGLKPQMINIIKKQLRKSIEKGCLDYLFENKNEHLVEESKSIDMWKKWTSIRYSKIEYIIKTGRTATIGLRCYTGSSNKEFTFRIRLRKSGFHWQIVELTDFLNLGKLVDKG
jgi:hypothetical protein